MNRDVKAFVISAAVIVLCSCSESTTAASATASPEAPLSSPTAVQAQSPSASPSKSPAEVALPSASPPPAGSPVPRQVLAPARVVAAVGLCSTPLFTTADGNYLPLFCARGEINVLAWKGYTAITPHLLAAGPNPSLDQLHAAFNADFGLHATNVEALYGYQLANAYYAWNFPPSTPCEDIYRTATC